MKTQHTPGPWKQMTETERYQADLKAHEAYMERRRPLPWQFVSGGFYDHHAYKKAMSEWEMARFCDAPNPPGYYRANND